MSWSTSEARPGYRCKELQVGACTVKIYRPDRYTERQLQQTRTALEAALLEHHKRRSQT